MALFRWLILLVCSLPIGLYAQLGRDSIWSLPSVQVSASRLQFQDWGLKVEKLDSLQAQVFASANIGDWLFNASQAFIKNYGAGRLATSSFRGGSASQSIVLWNGFNVQNPMLGQTDLSLLPISLMDEVRVDLGSSSVLWGSGAIGGAIQLNNSNSVIAQSGWQARLQTGLGSFNNRYAQGKLQYRNRHWTSALRGLSNGAQNNYPFRDFFGEKKRLPHSKLLMNSMLWENYWQTRNNSLSWHSWYQNTHREIPPISSQQISQAQQYDAAFRTMIDAKHYGNWGKLNLRGALFREQLDYQDSLVQLDSKSKAWTAIGEAIFETAAYKWGHAQLGFHHTGVWAMASNYEGQIQQQRNAFFAQFEPSIFQKKWRSLLQLRQEWVDGRRLPLLPGLRIQGQMGLLQLHASLNRNYRIPTLNDLHWVPGGNPLLRPEQGWSSELGWNWEKKNEQSGWQLGITGFNRVIQDWILWLPGAAYWSPVNVQKVWSRGIETKIGFQRRQGKWHWGVNASYDYLRSTVMESNQVNDASVGQQLIYVPQQKGLLQARVQRGVWASWYVQNFVGSVATLPDHSATLPAYTLGDFFISWQKKAKPKDWGTQVSINVHNVWNTAYQSVVSRPMPGRSLMLNLKFEF